jgi:hypothetical protein
MVRQDSRLGARPGPAYMVATGVLTGRTAALSSKDLGRGDLGRQGAP